MREHRMNSHVYAVLSTAGLTFLFVLLFCYLFLGLGLLVLGLITVPCALLGRAGMLTVVTDLSQTELLLVSAGILLLGLGMCAGAGIVFPAAFGLYSRSRKVLRIKRERELCEYESSGEDTGENGAEAT